MYSFFKIFQAPQEYLNLEQSKSRLSDKVCLLLHVGKHQTGKLVGLSGNVLVKSNISKSKFDNVFDINRPRRGGRALGCPMTGDSARAPGTACGGRTALYCHSGPP